MKKLTIIWLMEAYSPISSAGISAQGSRTGGKIFMRTNMMTAAMVAMTLIICYSRIYLAYHFPFDIVLGLATGLCSVGLSLLLVKGTIKLWNRRKESHK